MIIIERFSIVNRVARGFRKNQDQASRAQVRAHLVRVLKIGMAVEATRAHQSHDPCLDRGLGILAQPPGPGALVPSHATNVQPIA